MDLTLDKLLSVGARSRFATVTADGPFEGTDGFADAARRIAGETTGMTSDHIYAVCILVAHEAGIDPQAAIVIGTAIDSIRRSVLPSTSQGDPA